MKDLNISKGQPSPIGATINQVGVNFSLYSKNATHVELLLFDSEDHSHPERVIVLDPKKNRTFHYWHVCVEGLKSGQLYGYRVYGPYQAEEGFRFDGTKVLLDPYARAIVSNTYDRKAATIFGEDNCPQAMKSVVVDTSAYDWEEDRPLNHSFGNSIIYELHVAGFTKHPNSGVSDDLRGTYRGLIEKIPYLQSLGITTVELMPVQQFDPYDLPNKHLKNYWGYSPIGFFAPHNGYSSSSDPLDVLDEFRDMVKALHRANIAIILDIVFNHTAEGNEQGPTLSFKGIENRAYYILDDDRQFYRDFTGTGNSVRANHSVVRRLIRDCLNYWVSEFHVDGFRFDLASVLSRDEFGNQMLHPPILWSIDSEPTLASSKIVAESWDIHIYQLGSFTGERWAEWNGKFRDDVRRFVKGDHGLISTLANRITASMDVFKDIFKDPNRSINFITSHDGFTMNDLVSFDKKYNMANGEDNQDGMDENHSWNHGVEGFTDDPAIEYLRQKQIKNFFTILMISQGTPMITMGDEVRRTQQGNNNAYCQDNEISWFDWDLTEKNSELLSFVKQLIQFNLSTGFFQEEIYWVAPEPLSLTSITFHGTQLNHPDWSHHSNTLAFTLRNTKFQQIIHVMLNAYHEPLAFELPNETGIVWHKVIDTAAPSGHDIFLPPEVPALPGANEYVVRERSIVLLISPYQ